MNNLEEIKILNRYDVENITNEDFQKAKNTIFSEPQVDVCYEEEYIPETGSIVFGTEFLPGQFDQRANSLSECLQIITGGEKLTVKSAKIYVLKGKLSNEEIAKITNNVEMLDFGKMFIRKARNFKR